MPSVLDIEGASLQILRQPKLPIRKPYTYHKTPSFQKIPPYAHVFIVRLYKQGCTLQEIGNKFNVSRERIRQILKKMGCSAKDGGLFIRLSPKRDAEELKRSERKRGVRRGYVLPEHILNKPTGQRTREDERERSKLYHNALYKNSEKYRDSCSFKSNFKHKFGQTPKQHKLYQGDQEWQETIELVMLAGRIAWYQSRGLSLPSLVYLQLRKLKLLQAD